MSEPLLVAVVAAVGAAIALGTVVAPTGEWGPSATNLRGVALPVVLGVAIVVGTVGGGLIAVLVEVDGRPSGERLAVLAALLVIFVAGLYDDYRAGPGRGLVGHFRELLAGRFTTGILKLLAAVAGGLVVALATHAPANRLMIGVPLMAGCANLWNLLDLAPGRAIKYYLPAGIAVVSASWGSASALVGVAGLAAALAVFPFDLRERAMLGDSGSNVLGFLVGVGLYRALPLAGLGAALAVVLLLHLLAETVRLSRVIEAASLLRWFDRLGRHPHVPDGSRDE